MHYDPQLKRPDITWFNLGAIGAWMGHIEVWRRAKARGIKYALVFEDNVIATARLHREVERVVQEKGDSFEAVLLPLYRARAGWSRGNARARQMDFKHEMLPRTHSQFLTVRRKVHVPHG